MRRFEQLLTAAAGTNFRLWPMYRSGAKQPQAENPGVNGLSNGQ